MLILGKLPHYQIVSWILQQPIQFYLINFEGHINNHYTLLLWGGVWDSLKCIIDTQSHDTSKLSIYYAVAR